MLYRGDRAKDEEETAPFASEEMQVPTEPAPTYLAPSPLLRATQLWMVRAAVGLACLAVGIASGALVRSFEARSDSAPQVLVGRGKATGAASHTHPILLPSADARNVERPRAQVANADTGTSKASVLSPMQRPTAATTLKPGKRVAEHPRSALLRAAKPAKGTAAVGRKAKTPLKRKSKTAAR